MKKILIAFTLFVVICLLVQWLMPIGDRRPFPQAFREGMNAVKWVKFVDSNYCYTFMYPSFFVREERTDGSVAFGYHAHEMNVILESKVSDADDQRRLEYIREGEMEDLKDYRYYLHGIQRGGKLYSLALYYPAEYRHCMQRLIWKVKTWKCDTIRLRMPDKETSLIKK
ncbi:hypothetical protein HMPREF3034_00245 [Prevotella sp. DNF00663]|uniref:hypothetical protein n=1 Tax=unclassified Prevotella TaxID=2638335 RepID=UPI00051335B1|nr:MULTISPECIES: hypothetical protein [unclassified Prevotella]KGI61356.1 hypothetical protein HMPREF0671_00930 [Prevotella sp. S7 MS 2]KXB85393.1 hypothetical protein HMPREF3034_00245 [Prevotella sp. DNF00663]